MIRKALLILILLTSVALPLHIAAQEVILTCNGGRTYGGGTDRAWIRLDNHINVSSVQFDLLFDTEVLTIGTMSRTDRTQHLDVFEWEPIERGIRVVIADPMRTIHYDPYGGSIAEFSVHVRYGAPPDTITLRLGRAELRDFQGNDIFFKTQGGTFIVLPSATLTVWKTYAVPGSRENSTTIVMSHFVFVESIRFDLFVDTHIISVSDVLPVPDIEAVFPDFTWYLIDGGIHVILPNATGPFGATHTKPLCYIISDISSDAQRTATYNLTFANVVLTDSLNNEIPTAVVEGELYIPSYDASLSVGTGRGKPGSTNNKVWIELSGNYFDLTAIAFDLLFDTHNIFIDNLEKTETSAAFANFEWSAIPGGAHISMSNETIAVPRGSYRYLIKILFNIAPDAPRKEYALNLSNPVLRNPFGNEIITTTDDGRIYVVESMALTVDSGGGFPGSGGNMVPVILETIVTFTVSELYVSFNNNWLSVSDVTPTYITGGVRIFSWKPTEEGIMIFVWTSGRGPAIGSIADIYFDVSENAPLGTYSLDIDSVLIVDGLGGIIPTDTFDGTFSVVQKGDVNQDGDIDVRDVILTIYILLGRHNPTSIERSVADCNDDDAINVLDVMCVVNIILGG